MPSTNFDNAHARATTVISVHTDHIDTTTARATFALSIPPNYANNPTTRHTHGAATATFFDNITSIAMMASRRYWGRGCRGVCT